MIVSFFGRGTGRGSGPIDYLLGRDRSRERAQLLRGHPDETEALINSSKYTKKYTSGVLSFEEANISTQQKRELMDSFEHCLFPGMDKNQYNILWVEHRDKGRLELNFVIPNLELTSNKRLQPFYHKSDLSRVDAWRTVKNLECGFSDPTEPSKKRTFIQPKDLPRSKLEALEAITDGLIELLASETIFDRQGIIKTLESAGFEIARQTKTSISIKDPSGGQNLRLRGAIYEQDFRFSKDLQRNIEERSRKHQQSLRERGQEARERLERGLEIKQRELEQRYPAKPERLTATDLFEPATYELEPFQNMASSFDCAHHSSAWADELERMVGIKNSGQFDSDQTSRKNTSDAREQNQWDQNYQLYDNGECQQTMCFDRPEIQRSDMGQQRQAIRHTGEQIDDGARKLIINDISWTNERFRELREQSKADRTSNTQQLNQLNATSSGIRDVEQASNGIERAKQTIEQTIIAVAHAVEVIRTYAKEVSRGFGL